MYVIHAQFHTIGLKVCEQIILNLGAVPAVRYANIYLSFIKSPSWVLDGLCNCMLSEDERLKITEGKRLMARRADLKKAETNCRVWEEPTRWKCDLPVYTRHKELNSASVQAPQR